MDHDGARGLMAAAVQGDLGQDQERDLAVHLVGCTDCKGIYEGLRFAQSALGRLGRSVPPTKAVETAIHRATTVLRGEADPGPVARAPAVPPPAHLTPAAFTERPAVAPLLPDDVTTEADIGGTDIADASAIGAESGAGAPSAAEAPPEPAVPTVDIRSDPDVAAAADLAAASDIELTPRVVEAGPPLPTDEMEVQTAVPETAGPAEPSTPVAPGAFEPEEVEFIEPPERPQPGPPAAALPPLEPPAFADDDEDDDDFLEALNRAPDPPRPTVVPAAPSFPEIESPAIPGTVPGAAPVEGEEALETEGTDHVDVPAEPVIPGPLVTPPPPAVGPIGRAPDTPFGTVGGTVGGTGAVRPLEPFPPHHEETPLPYDLGPQTDELERPRTGAGPWLGAIAATIALALLAGFLITRGQGVGGDLPSADEVRSRVDRVFTEMKSLKASFAVRRLDLYPVQRSGSAFTYRFSDGETSGRIVYDRLEGYREQTTTVVGGQEISSRRIVRRKDETQAIVGEGSSTRLETQRNVPLGPPDGTLRPALGTLEQAIGSVAAMIVASSDLDVVGFKKLDEREVLQVRFPVEPNDLTRADQIDVLLDTGPSAGYFPIYVRREIGRSSARVLGPEEVLSDNAIATAFGDRERITTEIVELEDVIVDDIILPGDLVLEAPSGAETQTRDGNFARVPRADLGERVEFTPLFPESLPEGFEEQSLAVFTGRPGKWGPNGQLPAPDGIVQASYFDGKATIVVTQRNMPDGPFSIEGSPLQTGALPVQRRRVEQAEKVFFYGWSPETPPHAYGFLGNVFVMASGYVPAEDLIAVVSSMVQAPDEPPELQISPSPGATGSPDASPSTGGTTSGSPSPSPATTSAPTATPVS